MQEQFDGINDDIRTLQTNNGLSDEDAAYLIQKTKFCRLPANDVGMGLPVYASQLHETNINSKTSHNKKHVPFVEVNLSNGRTVYLRKTTLVWML